MTRELSLACWSSATPLKVTTAKWPPGCRFTATLFSVGDGRSDTSCEGVQTHASNDATLSLAPSVEVAWMLIHRHVATALAPRAQPDTDKF